VSLRSAIVRCLQNDKTSVSNPDPDPDPVRIQADQNGPKKGENFKKFHSLRDL
jgi:hypothetical protein